MKQIQYIQRKSLLYKSGVEYADYGLNHVEGCSHGCTYPCYAMMMKKRCGIIKTYQDWIKPKIVGNALELLDKELPRHKSKIKRVFLCFATDPFMYGQSEVEELTLKILRRLNRDEIKSILISKGAYPKVLTNNKTYNQTNEYGATVVSLSEDFRKQFEPFAAPINLRIEALKKLHDAGLKTWVSMEPYPTSNIVKQDIQQILTRLSFVDRIVFGRWNYSKNISTFNHYREFYNSMAYEVIKFGMKNSIDIHIKNGTINLDFLTNDHSFQKQLLKKHLIKV